MRFTKLAVLGMSAMLLAGCDDEGDAIVAPDRPRAAVRFINAVPDTLVTDWRFVDQLELSPYEVGFAFRAMTDYQGVAPGSRHFKIFPGTNDLSTQFALIDQMVDFTQNNNYTLIHTGFSVDGRTPADQLLVLQDAVPTVAATEVSVRAMHLGANLGNVDIFVWRSSGGAAAPTTPTFTNVAYGSVTPYVTLAPGTITFRATATGTTTPILAEVTAPAGQAANPAANLQALGGSTQGGSAILGLLVPRSVDGTGAPQTTAFRVPTFIFAIDKHPR